MEQTTLSQKVYDNVFERLRTGDLKPGTRLVNRTLAAELGTSTIPVREAISRLVSQGLLDSTPGGGAFVRTPDPNELGELYDVREALETLAAAEAARFATDELIADLRVSCEQFHIIAAAIEPGKYASRNLFNRWLASEEQFHHRLVAATRNRWLIKTLQSVRVITQVFTAQRLIPRLLTRAVADETAQQHEAILEILAKRDVVRARAWMTAHIRNGRAMVLGHLASGSGSMAVSNERRAATKGHRP
jgi:DNA-binding GntR family transcriptional regulator